MKLATRNSVQQTLPVFTKLGTIFNEAQLTFDRILYEAKKKYSKKLSSRFMVYINHKRMK